MTAGSDLLNREPLLEREGTLADVRNLLAAARAGNGGALAIEGAGGLGKTRVLEAAQEFARETGMQLVRARGADSEREFPFGGALQLFEPIVRRSPELTEGAAALALPVFDGAYLAASAGPLFSALHGLYWVTANLAAEGPLLLCVDDVQSLDDPTLAYLLYLVRRIEDLPVALIVATRPLDAAAHLPLAELVWHPSVTHARLAPLSAAAVASVVRAIFDEAADDAFCSACAELSGGNPFLLMESLRALEADGIASTADGTRHIRSLEPRAITRAVLLRLSRLGAGARELAKAAAILDEHAPVGLAGAVAGLDAEAAVRAAEQLAAVSILDPGDALRFTHALLREAVLADIPAKEQAGLHARAARLLRERHAPVERVARHLLAAPPSRDAQNVEILRAAASHAAAAEMASAIAYLTRALAEPPATREQRAEILTELARAEVGTDPAAASGHIAEAQALHEDARRTAGLQLELGRTLSVQGRHSEAADTFLAGSRLLPEDDPLARELRGWFVSASVFVERLRPRGLELAAELASRPPSDPTTAELAVLAQIAVQRMLGGEPLSAVRPQVEAAWRGGELLAAETVDGYSWTHVTAVYLWGGDFATAEEIAADALEAARRRGSVMAFAAATYIRASARLWAGNVTECLGDIEQTLEIHRRDGWNMYIGATRYIHAEALIERGDPAAAERSLAELTSEQVAGSAEGALVLYARARARLAQGDNEAALVGFEEARAAADAAHAIVHQLLPWWAGAAEARGRLGDRAGALAVLAEVEPSVRRTELTGRLGQLLTVRAHLQEPAEALVSLDEAVAVLERSQSRIELARALAARGAFMRRAGQQRAALESLRRALDISHTLGAVAVERIVRDELRVAGARPRRARAAGLDALTPSELRIARLAADGRTNREIAEALFVSRKTVEYHLRNAFAKLSIGSRQQLAPLLAKTGSSEAG